MIFNAETRRRREDGVLECEAHAKLRRSKLRL